MTVCRRRAVVLAEAGRPLPPGVDAEEEDVAARDPQLDEVGEELPEPRAARPDDDVGARRLGGGRPAGLDPHGRARAPASRARAWRTPASGSNSTELELVAAERRDSSRGAPRPASAARQAIPSRSSAASLRPVKSEKPVSNHATPTGSKSRTPVSSSSSRQSSSERRADSVYQSSSPCEKRSSRVSPPEPERTFARRVLLDERHVPAAPAELARGRGPEHAGADDDGAAHCGVTVSRSTSGRW